MFKSFRPLYSQRVSEIVTSDRRLSPSYCHWSLVFVRLHLAVSPSIRSAEQATNHHLQPAHLRLSSEKRPLNMSCNATSNDQARSCGHCGVSQAQRAVRRQQLRSLYALPLYSLPPELVLVILNRLNLDDYPSIVAATYHLLQHHGLAPRLSEPDLQRIVKRLKSPLSGQSSSPLLLMSFLSSVRALPAELLLQIQSYLNPQDKINFVLAMYGWNKL